MDTLEYNWCGEKNTGCNAVKLNDDIELPSFKFAQLCVNRTLAETASGESKFKEDVEK